MGGHRAAGARCMSPPWPAGAGRRHRPASLRYVPNGIVRKADAEGRARVRVHAHPQAPRRSARTSCALGARRPQRQRLGDGRGPRARGTRPNGVHGKRTMGATSERLSARPGRGAAVGGGDAAAVARVGCEESRTVATATRDTAAPTHASPARDETTMPPEAPADGLRAIFGRPTESRPGGPRTAAPVQGILDRAAAPRAGRDAGQAIDERRRVTLRVREIEQADRGGGEGEAR